MSNAETVLFLMGAGILLIVVNFAFNVVWSNRDSKTLEEKLASALADLDRRETAFLEMVDNVVREEKLKRLPQREREWREKFGGGEEDDTGEV